MQRAGENVGFTNRGMDTVMAGFLASPSHRRNLDDPLWTSVGVGVAANGGDRYVVVLFGTKGPQKLVKRPKPAPTVTLPA